MKNLLILSLIINLVFTADLADKVFCTANVSVCESKCCSTVYNAAVVAKTAETQYICIPKGAAADQDIIITDTTGIFLSTNNYKVSINCKNFSA